MSATANMSPAYSRLEKMSGDLVLADFSKNLRRVSKEVYYSMKEIALAALINLRFCDPQLNLVLSPLIAICMFLFLLAAANFTVGNFFDTLREKYCTHERETCGNWAFVLKVAFYTLSAFFASLAIGILMCAVITRLKMSREAKYYMNFRYHLLRADAEARTIKFFDDKNTKEGSISFAAVYYTRCLRIEEEMKKEGLHLADFKVFGIGVRTRPAKYARRIIEVSKTQVLDNVINEITGERSPTNHDQRKVVPEHVPTSDVESPPSAPIEAGSVAHSCEHAPATQDAVLVPVVQNTDHSPVPQADV